MACQCSNNSPFDFWCSGISNFPYEENFIIKGVKIGSTGFGTKVLVQEVLYGTPPADTLLFWNFNVLINIFSDWSIYCLYFLENETQSDTFILTAGYATLSISGFGLVSGAITSLCPTGSLIVQDNWVYGQIAEGVSSMPYPQFVEMMEECLPTVGMEQLPPNPEAAVEAVSCYPNPIQSNTTTQVQFSLREAAPIDVAVFDISGKQVSQVVQNRYYAKGTHLLTIDMETLPLASGIYFCRISTPHGQGVCKIVVVR